MQGLPLSSVKSPPVFSLNGSGSLWTSSSTLETFFPEANVAELTPCGRFRNFCNSTVSDSLSFMSHPSTTLFSGASSSLDESLLRIGSVILNDLNFI